MDEWLYRAPKASDISTEAFLAALAPGGIWSVRWDVAERLAPFPEKVVLAKARKLLKQGVIHGCGCGCRGDWHVPNGCC